MSYLAERKGDHHVLCTAHRTDLDYDPDHVYCPIPDEWQPIRIARGGDLASRVEDLIAWARSRIGHCRTQELKFAPTSDASLEAGVERRTLLAVLNVLRDGGQLR